VTAEAPVLALQLPDRGRISLRPPPFRRWMVPRGRLVRRLVASRDIPIVLVVAPPGYGKSTLLAEWAARDDRPFAWIALAPDAVEDGIGEAMRLVDEAEPSVIVVDDAQIGDAASVRRLVLAAQRLPASTTLALASRTAPSAPIGRLRAHHLVLEIGERELAMTGLEAARLLAATGLELDSGQLDRLVERTAGWPAPLYLAGLAIAEQPDADRAIADFSGADRLVADYLRTELLDSLTDRQRTFLRRSSVLPRLSGPLCDAVLATRGSTAMLATVADRGVPLEPLDRCDTTFRHHPLLAAALRAELNRIEPDLEPELHRRAVDWHDAHGEPLEALQHAVAGRDSERAGRLLWALAPRAIAEGREASLGVWLEAFSDRQRCAHPVLALSSAAFHVSQGRRDHAERVLQAVPDEHEPHAAVAMLRACIARDGAVRMGEDAEQACALAAPDSAAQGLGRLLMGVARHLTGDGAAARVLLEDAARRTVGRINAVAALAYTQLALIAVDDGDWDGAAHRAEEASATLAPVAAPDAARALVLAVYAAIAAHRGEIAQARHDAADAHRLLASVEGFAPWVNGQTHVWLARAEFRLSDGPTARMLLARAARAQAQMPDARVLAQWVHDGWERADAFAETATGDGPTLTNAELRVLRLLPSHMSFREIGERLQVSPNTVKTQARSVYRKLNVSRRSGAVSRGRAAGLIDG
jgi:LuxR family transcriptional regulator, maltose regulon positive regulatory protein